MANVIIKRPDQLKLYIPIQYDSQPKTQNLFAKYFIQKREQQAGQSKEVKKKSFTIDHDFFRIKARKNTIAKQSKNDKTISFQ